VEGGTPEALGPAQGLATGGAEVRISGHHLGTCSVRRSAAPLEPSFAPTGCAGVIVHFGKEPGLVLEAHESYAIAFAPPAGEAEPEEVEVAVTTPAGTSAPGAGDLFRELAAPRAGPPAAGPSVSSVSPSEGEAPGFDAVTIEGANLLPPGVSACVGCAGTVVRFGATSVSVLEGTQGALRVVDPPGETGPVYVTVSVEGEPSPTGAADRFTYLAPASAFTLEAIPSPSDNAEPRLGGASAERPGSAVEAKVYAGTAVAETPVFEGQVGAASGHWAVTIAPPLPDGTYTVVAEQLSKDGTPISARRIATFTIDTKPPRVTITEPAPGALASGGFEVVGGEAGVEPDDSQEVTVTLYGDGSLSDPLESHVVRATGGRWSSVFAGLTPGAYELRAEQVDEAGNRGASAAVPFTVSASAEAAPAPRSPGPPSVSFSWVPARPEAEEPVTLVSEATAEAPIEAYAWAIAPGAFHAGGPVLTTSFASAGMHVVRLEVTAAAGGTAIASRTIEVAPRAPTLMEPFPIVRFVGTDTRLGARLSLVSVHAPAGARVSVRCRGRGCPFQVLHRVVPARRRVGEVRLRKLERPLRAGVVLVIRVEAPGEIGKYTRLAIRRGNIPKRFDACLEPGQPKPVACPS
jgi:hypothetical protein